MKTAGAVLLVVVCVGRVSGQTCTPADYITYTDDTDFNGHDLSPPSGFANSTPNSCIAACEANWDCYAIVLQSDGTCWLKDRNYRQDVELKSTTVLAVDMSCLRPCTPADYITFTDGTDSNGNDLVPPGSIPNSSQSSCTAACEANEECYAIVLESNGLCWLKNKNYSQDVQVKSTTILAVNMSCLRKGGASPPLAPGPPATVDAPTNTSAPASIPSTPETGTTSTTDLRTNPAPAAELPDSGSSSAKLPSIGIIVGSVLGAVGLVSAAIAAVMYRRRKAATAMTSGDDVTRAAAALQDSNTTPPPVPAITAPAEGSLPGFPAVPALSPLVAKLEAPVPPQPTVQGSSVVVDMRSRKLAVSMDSDSSGTQGVDHRRGEPTQSDSGPVAATVSATVHSAPTTSTSQLTVHAAATVASMAGTRDTGSSLAAANLGADKVMLLKRQLDTLAHTRQPLARRYLLLDSSEQRSGSQGVVRFAVHTRNREKRFALKFFMDQDAFAAECAIYANEALHGVLPPVEDIFTNEEEGAVLGAPLPPMIVMERGESLDIWAQRCKPDFWMSLAIAGQLATRLERLHAAGLVHRDLKPANVMWLPSTASFTFLDFGCAAPIGTTARIKCTLAYAAPEVAHSLTAGHAHANIDPAVDVWSLGLVMYEFFVGDRVLHGSKEQVLRALLTPGSLPWEEGGHRWERDMRRLGILKDVVLSMLVRDPAKRVTAEEVCASLKRCMQRESTLASCTANPGTHA